jgi:hypothetical protein
MLIMGENWYPTPVYQLSAMIGNRLSESLLGLVGMASKNGAVPVIRD